MPQSIDRLSDLTAPQKAVLEAWERVPALRETFFFTGGTLLKALGIVPRESNDLDFFTFHTVDSRLYIERLQQASTTLEDLFGDAQLQKTDRGFKHVASSMLIDMILDTTPPIEPFVRMGKAQAASLPDLAAHKASALCSRDEVKDFIDIAFLTKYRHWSLGNLAELAERKFSLGTVTEEKLLTELLSKRDAFPVTPDLFLRDGEKNALIVSAQVNTLIDQSTL